jgi:hypothetical protein
MADQVFVGTVVLPDRIVDDGYVLVGDGLVQANATEATAFLFFLARLTPKCTAAVRRARRTLYGRLAALPPAA